MEFREILKDFLDENSLSQRIFAEKIGVNQSQISEWLSGKAKQGYDSLRQMAIAFNVSADFFLGITDEY